MLNGKTEEAICRILGQGRENLRDEMNMESKTKTSNGKKHEEKSGTVLSYTVLYISADRWSEWNKG